MMASWLRANFGFHSAYFMGNYLYGDNEKPEKTCSALPIDGIEGYEFPKEAGFKSPRDYDRLIGRCGLHIEKSFIVVLGIEKVEGGYQEIVSVNRENVEEVVCAMRKLTGARRIIHTFGSRLGFWATALQGSSGGLVNGLDNICVNTTNSQQGSIWHTWCPSDRARHVFRTNSHFLPCTPNSTEDFRLFARYLFW
jgi:hypothetical protein